MDENSNIPISKAIYEKLEKLRIFLNTDMNELVEFAFQEMFQLAKDDPNVFLEMFGQYKKLKDLLE